MKKIALVTCLVFILLITATSPVFAKLSNSTEMFKTSSANLGSHLVALPVDLVQVTASSCWTLVEVLIYPFRLIF